MVFSFVIVSKSQPLEYEAVSYLWGGNDGKQEMAVRTIGSYKFIPLDSKLNFGLPLFTHSAPIFVQCLKAPIYPIH